MSNYVDMHLDVLASSPDEISEIEFALHEPCEELLAWVAKRWDADPKELAGDVKRIVTFKATQNLGYVDSSINKARRFKSGWKDKFWGVVWTHVFFVSEAFPSAIFLGEYWDSCMSYSGKRVIKAGHEFRSVQDGHQQAQGYDWALPDIFAPFRAEYQNGDEFGSLWNDWMDGMRWQLDLLEQRYSSKTDLKREADDAEAEKFHAAGHDPEPPTAE